MKKLLITCVAFALLSVSEAQVEVAHDPAGEVPSVFDVDAISFASSKPAFSRLDVYAAIPYEELSFVKSDDRFLASYEMTIDIFDSSKTLVVEKLWTEEVKAATFDQTVSTGSFSILERSFDLSPGVYQISIQCRDLESKVTRHVGKQLTISDYSKPGLQLSDVMLVSKLVVNGDKRSMTPSISANVGAIAPPMHIFLEAYNSAKPDSFKCELTVFTSKDEQVGKSDTTCFLKPGRNQIFLQYDQSSLPIGDYKMYVQAYPSGAGGKMAATTSRSFLMRWEGVPKGIKDLDVAIDQLAYIAKDKELQHIKEAKTPEEKQKRFFEFWKKKDPNPNTPRNEKMEEYYGRVDYANKHFKHYIEGWRTDMGMVYIMFGTPNNVDRHPFDSDSKPFEVWSYYDLNYNFVFVDQTGFGDFRLNTPIWDIWQRPRD